MQTVFLWVLYWQQGIQRQRLWNQCPMHQIPKRESAGHLLNTWGRLRLKISMMGPILGVIGSIIRKEVNKEVNILGTVESMHTLHSSQIIYFLIYFLPVFSYVQFSCTSCGCSYMGIFNFWWDPFNSVLQIYFTGAGPIIRSPHCPYMKPEDYGNNQQVPTHSKT